MIKITVNILTSIKKRRANYKNSEAFWFKQMMQQSNEKSFLRGIYQWLDHSRRKYTDNTLNGFSQDNEALNKSLSTLKRNAYSEEASQDVNINRLKSDTRKQRNNHIKEGEQSPNNPLYLIKDINPSK